MWNVNKLETKLTPGKSARVGSKERPIRKCGIDKFYQTQRPKAWVDEQNKINIEKTLGNDRSYDEARITKHPSPQPYVEPLVKSPKRKDTVITLEKEKDAPQLSCALTGIC